MKTIYHYDASHPTQTGSFELNLFQVVARSMDWAGTSMLTASYNNSKYILITMK